MKLDDKLRIEYMKLYGTMSIDKPQLHVRDYWATRIQDHQSAYVQAAAAVHAPWIFVGLIHLMECELNFTCHLHNGDPLTMRTKHFPTGCPVSGRPPFTWLDSAVDALKFKHVDLVREWDLTTLLFQLESYNGLGYRIHHPEINSPYLWAGTNHYKVGKYIADGEYSATAVSKQIGAAPVLQKLLAFSVSSLPTSGTISSQSEQT